jgi:Protein of unknown function (DUF4236)
MGLVFRRRKRLGRGRTLNVSGRGASVSQRAGRLTVSSRGRASVRLLPGLSFRLRLWK